jgi:predicted TIM-barrel enzyme
MPFIPYQECLDRLQSQVEQQKPIIGAGAGTGISAKFAERGGVDIIIIYNSDAIEWLDVEVLPVSWLTEMLTK